MLVSLLIHMIPNIIYISKIYDTISVDIIIFIIFSVLFLTEPSSEVMSVSSVSFLTYCISPYYTYVSKINYAISIDIVVIRIFNFYLNIYLLKTSSVISNDIREIVCSIIVFWCVIAYISVFGINCFNTSMFI